MYLHSQAHLIAKDGAESSKDNGHTYFSFGAPMSEKKVDSVFNPSNKQDQDIQQNEGDYVSNPLNIFDFSTYNKPGHGTENYGEAKRLKELEKLNKVKDNENVK